jgi:hypothetical protein
VVIGEEMKSTINLTNVYGTKSILLDQYPPEAWDFLEGDADGIDKASIKMLYEAVPWLFRGLQILTTAASSVPVCLTNGKTDAGYLGGEITSPFPFVDDLPVLLRRICASVILEGYGYLFRDKAKTVNATKKLWYWNPLSVKFDKKKTEETRIISFTRKNGARTEPYTSDQVVYFWPADVYVEIGPPTSSPAKAALSAAGVLYNVDQYVAAYFKRGAIKAMMLSVKGAPNPDQKTELQKWWKDITGGIKKAFNVFTMNADAVTATTIGDGLEGLQDSALTQEKREDISTALGIPQTILFSTGASGIGGGGVASEDTTRFYRQTVVPLVKFFCDVLNQQQFKGLDYRLEVREEEMDIFQEDENQRASALSSLATAMEDPETFLLSAEILGYDLSDEVEAKILALIAKKEENARQMAEQLKPKEPPAEEDPVQDAPPEDMARLRRKALKNIGKRFAFESDTIPNLSSMLEKIYACACEDEIKALFEKSETVSEIPVFSQPDYSGLIEALRLECQLIKSVPSGQTGQSVTIVDTTGKAVEHNMVEYRKANQNVVDAVNAMSEKIASIPAPVVNLPAPVVNVTVPEQPAPVVNVVKNEPDESRDIVKLIRKLANGKK